jgi:hypothetical protein
MDYYQKLIMDLLNFKLVEFKNKDKDKKKWIKNRPLNYRFHMELLWQKLWKNKF